jgi:hypothetical protein
MASLSCITSDQTVRQAACASPACAAFLRSWPDALRGGRWTLQQLGPFARLHGWDEQAFLNRLSQLAGVPLRTRREPSSARSPLPLIFIALVVGVGLGTAFGVGLLLRIAAGARYDAVAGSSVHVHGLAQLWGWMTLFVFAVGTHLLRQNTTRPTPRWLESAAAAFILAGLTAFFGGLYPPLRAAFPEIDVAGSVLLLLGAASFGLSIAWSLSGALKNQRRHGLMFLVAWLLSWAAADLWLRLRYAQAPVLPDPARALLIVLPVLGLATNAIYGFGIRLIPGLLNITRLRRRWFAPALLLHNIGLCLFLVPLRVTATAGAVMMLLGAIGYVIGMNGLRGTPSRPIYGIDPRGHVLIRAAFFWLICGLAMIAAQQVYPRLPHAYGGAWRHALTVGFITTMILGVGYRLIPVFIKQPLASSRLMLVSAALILVGNAGRVALELLTIGGWTWSYRAMGISGLLELAALVLFGINLALTARNRRRIYRCGEPVMPDTRVREAINVYPRLQERLQAVGVTMFDSAPFVAPSMTFGALALASGKEPWELLRTVGLAPASTSGDGVSCGKTEWT